jgi:hypothetical protein
VVAQMMAEKKPVAIYDLTVNYLKRPLDKITAMFPMGAIEELADVARLLYISMLHRLCQRVNDYCRRRKENKYPRVKEATNQTEESKCKKRKRAPNMSQIVQPGMFKKYQSRFLLTPSDAQYLRQYR